VVYDKSNGVSLHMGPKFSRHWKPPFPLEGVFKT